MTCFPKNFPIFSICPDRRVPRCSNSTRIYFILISGAACNGSFETARFWKYFHIGRSDGYSSRIEANAFVVLEAGATAPETELSNYASDHLAHFECPQKIYFVLELPKTATGKVQKYVLRGKRAISKQ